jgi:molybdopterin/thiamine biosynthesis adenylyltransferase
MSETYKRQLGLIGEEGQDKLKNAKVLVVGAGGIGNIAAKYLGAMGVGDLIIQDGDVIDQSNLNRQLLFNTESIGYNKAEKLSDVIRKINKDIKCYPEPKMLTEKHILEGFDIVLDCTDNMETSYILESKCLELGIPLVFAKTSNYCGVVTIIKDKKYLKRNYPTKQLNKDHSVFPAIGGIIGSFQASLAIKLILGKKTNDKVYHFDLLNDSFIQFEKGDN